MSNKHLFVPAALVGLAALLTSCSVKEDRISTSKVFVDVRTFDLDQTPISTKASNTTPPHRIVFKAIDSKGNTAYECTQVSTQDGFGTLEFDLAQGNYTLVAVAHDVSNASNSDLVANINSTTSATMPETKVFDTFCGTKSITVLPKTPFAAGMTLPRVNSQFRICISDAVPANISRLEIIANSAGTAETGPASINLTNGFALTSRQYKTEFDISKEAGNSNIMAGINLFLTSAEQDINITATAYDSSNNVIATHTLTNIPMKQNRQTIATGKFFSGNGAGSFTFNTGWETAANVAF